MAGSDWLLPHPANPTARASQGRRGARIETLI
jgi:hypothetical protein